MTAYKLPLLVSVHGIRTEGKWQKLLAEVAADQAVPIRMFDYGYFNTFKFLFGPSRRKKIREFYEYYSTIVSDKKISVDPDDFCKRPSIVAHSFGTYIVANCMLKHRDVKFDKIVLCGSILPEDFDWSVLLGRDQVNMIRNECGHLDIWAGRVGIFVPGTGGSGRKGFRFCGASFKQEHFDLHEHSDYFFRNHIEKEWFPFLGKRPSGFVVKNGRDIEAREEFTKTLDATHEVDLKHYADLEHYQDVDLPRGLSLTWIDINPDIYTFLFDRTDQAVKGYINAMPVCDDLFDRIKAGGEIKDNEIKASEVMPFHSDQQLRIYLMSIAIDPGALHASDGLFQDALERLLYGFFYKLMWYAVDRRIRVTELVAVGWTAKGKRLCEWFGMSEVAKDSFGHPVYWIRLDVETLLKRRGLFSGMKRLLKTYREIDEAR